MVAKAIVETLKEMGYQAVHRGGDGEPRRRDAEGQRELLAGYGVTSETMGVPVRTDMDTGRPGHQLRRAADLFRSERL